ncbi:hypothetical protein IWQ62_003512 [Dispira parvispora]|uniref:UV radiation resistance-associated gene protein n=1 Tax=Dispira parvispora TaxID=1520584 RepID=A0A9W8ATM7_9FUNG|nr:hypothetical protein IWQ62_003512 [Dispira parvispora]
MATRQSTSRHKHSGPVPKVRYTYDDSTLVRLNTLEERLRSLHQRTQGTLTQLHQRYQTYERTAVVLHQAKSHQSRMNDYQIQLLRITERLQQAKRLSDAKRDLIRSRKYLLHAAQCQQDLERGYLDDNLVTLKQNRIIMESSRVMHGQQIAQYMEGLSFIFNITRDSDTMSTYAIGNGLPAPQSNAVTTMADQDINASVGFICHLVTLLARYLEIPLRYPIKYFASQSIIYNPSADMMRLNTKFPLYITKNEPAIFDYAFNLLNDNVIQVGSRQHES